MPLLGDLADRDGARERLLDGAGIAARRDLQLQNPISGHGDGLSDAAGRGVEPGPCDVGGQPGVDAEEDGDLRGRVEHQGNTSLRIALEVWVRRPVHRAEGGERHFLVTRADFTYVAIDEAGNKRVYDKR